VSGEVEVFLDVVPGETRGVIVRDGLCETLLIQRDSDDLQLRLGARSVGRVAEIDQGLNGAFVDLGSATAFLPLAKSHDIRQGAKIEVEVSAEPREFKAAVVRLIGPGEGEPRLLAAGPDVLQSLTRLAPGVLPVTDIQAVQAVMEAEEDALSQTSRFPSLGLDLSIERTRALIAVDMDYAPQPGRDARKGRRQANLAGLHQTARLLRLQRWAGLVAIDLIGTGQDVEAVMTTARAAFGRDPEVVFGPINRFGVLMLSLPWRRTPLEEVFNGREGRPSLETRAIAVVRRMKLAMLSDTTVPRFVVRCEPAEAAAAAPLVARLGPRAHIISDPAIAAGRSVVEEA